ncbi:hypothetical protein AB663_002862 [Microbacterium sp. XT11]|nr:hypothetical protein AB663_002862 [Microbacterium sp. XT11]
MDAAGEELADRIKALLGADPAVEERRMFGSRTFLVDGRILVGARAGGVLLVRVAEEQGAALSVRSGVSPAAMGARTMSARWLDVAPAVIADDQALMFWLDVAREHDDGRRHAARGSRSEGSDACRLRRCSMPSVRSHPARAARALLLTGTASACSRSVRQRAHGQCISGFGPERSISCCLIGAPQRGQARSALSAALGGGVFSYGPTDAGPAKRMRFRLIQL